MSQLLDWPFLLFVSFEAFSDFMHLSVFFNQPTGRAIQVESGYGERRPSMDTRQPRLRDSDAIIEVSFNCVLALFNLIAKLMCYAYVYAKRYCLLKVYGSTDCFAGFYR